MGSTMEPRTFDMQWVKGTDPKEGNWPGLRTNQVEKDLGMEITWDVPVALRDGVKVYVDVFRPDSFTGKLPIILSYSPYGKHGFKTFDMFPGADVPAGSVSRYAVWEGPDPSYWTQKGYCVINADARGSWGSEGNCTIMSTQEGIDGYDIVEWAGTLPWSNGRVGLSGLSYLSVSQWRIAENNPPHLACIQVFGGFSEVYRDYSHHGGIPETNFVKFMEWSCRFSHGLVEDWVKMQKEHHLYDNYQADKRAKLSQIKAPAYVVADWGDQGLHTRGNLVAWSEISSEQKWLEIHGRKKWQYYYSKPSLLRQEAFFQKFLKQEASEVDNWPTVRIETRERAHRNIARNEMEWPIARTRMVRMYLDNSTSRLLQDPPKSIGISRYASGDPKDALLFSHKFNEETELTGTMRLRLWVSAEHEDMDIFVRADKLDDSGVVVPFVAMSMMDDGPMALGWIRVSHRELDLERSTENHPWLQHRRQLLLRPNEVAPVDIEIMPSSTLFHPGDSLRLTIKGSDTWVYDRRQIQLHQDTVNQGPHSLYTGGPFESFLVMPVIDKET
ncbi:uncharacterized protein Z520_06382 [Fonsecaea multimorphosa CBS 102226]|uniref:Xaa-Pro dipeptidyl-peptidase C-terminal domain-containing protein n=1 Tax=Fonsecaea multimorphosa CBS 102226 TaxID=1442371 RepID=A0A0D2K387_9EURO|nr:uncharacterized protein Z520_06382 [Fonsecaea multimorphosa CBS 102226]KIX97604.1 hypothetical protein Z520_06382 [Fonsecaea multimorphosa CBS 102226]OAL24069.1 hypothetical protein AYO22_05950 [Fonsecaea multimorphosa]